MWSGAHMYLLPILLILYGLSRDAGTSEAARRRSGHAFPDCFTGCIAVSGGRRRRKTTSRSADRRRERL